MRYVLLFSLIRTILIAGTLVGAVLSSAEPATAGRLADGLPSTIVPVSNPQGHSNAGAGTPGPMTPGPMTPGPATPGLGRTPTFGTPNVVFVAGIWHIIRSQGEFYLWTHNGDTAIQITLESNGWWGLRQGTLERIVWSSGETRVDPFYDRPWQRATGATFPMSSAAFQGPSRWGTTSLDLAGDRLRIMLTDRGLIEIDTRTSGIVFRSSTGRTVTF